MFEQNSFKLSPCSFWLQWMCIAVLETAKQVLLPHEKTSFGMNIEKVLVGESLYIIYVNAENSRLQWVQWECFVGRGMRIFLTGTVLLANPSLRAESLKLSSASLKRSLIIIMHLWTLFFLAARGRAFFSS